MDFKYEVDPEFDELIDERGNSTLMFRKVHWGSKVGTEFTENDLPELRKWIITDTGEMANKGTTFLTPEGPGRLARAIIKRGYGTTADYIETLKEREDFDEALISVLGKKKVSDIKETEVEDTYYDPSEAIK